MALRSLSALACLLILQDAQAQTSPAKEQDLATELEVLLNTPISGASKREQRLMDSPQAIEVLTGDEIRQQGIYRLADALRLMTSIDVIERGNEATVAGIRGVMQNGRPRTVQILVDGVPLYNAELGSIDLDLLPIPVDAIERVEVVRGPSSSLYGANAVAGVIAITSRKADEGFKGFLRLSGAEHDTTRWSGESRYGSGGFGVALSYAGASLGASNADYPNLGSPEATPAKADNDRAHQSSWLVRPTYSWGDSTVWASAGDATKRFEQPTTEPESPWQATETKTLQGGWRQTWSLSFTSELRYSHTGQTWTLSPRPSLADQLGQLSALFPSLNVPTYSEFYSPVKAIDFRNDLFELQVNYAFSKDLHLVGGADSRKYEAGATSFQGLPVPVKADAKGLFVSLDWNTTPTFALSLGARWEDERIGGSRVSPRLAFVWNPTPTSAIRGGYFTATRSPQILEADINFNLVQPAGNPPFSAGATQVLTLPNAELKPEEIHNFELGYRLNVGITTLDLTVFQMTFKKLISETDPVTSQGVVATLIPGVPVLPLTVVTTTNVNQGEATDKGIELAITFQLQQGWTLGFNGTHLDYKTDPVGTYPYPNENLSYAPKLKLNAWTRYSQGRFSGFLAVQHGGATVAESAASFQGPALYERRDATTNIHFNATWDLAKGFSLGVYGRNANRATTPQGAGGVLNLREYQFARREIGGTLAYRF